MLRVHKLLIRDFVVGLSLCLLDFLLVGCFSSPIGLRANLIFGDHAAVKFIRCVLEIVIQLLPVNLAREFVASILVKAGVHRRSMFADRRRYEHGGLQVCGIQRRQDDGGQRKTDH